MMLKHSSFSLLLAGLYATAILSTTSFSDEVKLKNGEAITGTIVYESDDLVKIEVAVSASIKETKLLSRADIAEIIKEAPDNVAFAKLEKMLPTASLLPASAYKSMITTGPDSFLSAFPDSAHAPKVKEIKATLEEELDKVERGYIKLEAEWVSPQQKEEFEALTASKVRLLYMKRAAAGGNFNSLIGAMREFERLEERYYGSPAFAESIELALQVIPNLGGQLQKVSRDVEYRNAEFARNRETLDEVGKAQIDAARAREQAQIDAAIEADAKNGIKWITLNGRSKEAVDSYINLAVTELERIKQLDAALLKTQAEQLVEVDKMIAEGQLAAAKAKLTEAAALSGKSVSKSRSSKSKSGPSSYIAALDLKLDDRLAAEAEKEKAAAEAAASQSLAQNLKMSGEGEEDGEGAEGAGKTEGEGTEEDGEKSEKASTTNAFNALSGGNKKEKEDAEDKPKSQSSSSSKDKEERPRPVSVDVDEGGFSFGMLVPILTGVLVIVVVLLKVLGIGGKKEV